MSVAEWQIQFLRAVAMRQFHVYASAHVKAMTTLPPSDAEGQHAHYETLLKIMSIYESKAVTCLGVNGEHNPLSPKSLSILLKAAELPPLEEPEELEVSITPTPMGVTP